MKTLSPNKIAYRAGLISAAGLLLILVPLSLFVLSAPYSYIILLLPIVQFVLSYFVFSYLLEKYINQKIKLIYKTIHHEKIGKPLEGFMIDMEKDVFRDVNRDVESWAQENRREIQLLKEQAEYRRDFIGNLSHELKTPLTIIQGNILTLLEGAVDDKKIREKFLLKASDNVERLESLIHDLDTISQLTSEKAMVRLEKFDLLQLLKKVISNLEEKAKKADVKLKIKTHSAKEIFVEADRSKMDQVLTNLLINSINYSNEKSITTVSFDEVGDNILVEVADEGIGMAAYQLPRVFERFYRVDRSRSRHLGGTGLGLAIVKHIIEAHNQTINVRSEEHKGSVFSFTLKKAD